MQGFTTIDLIILIVYLAAVDWQEELNGNGYGHKHS